MDVQPGAGQASPSTWSFLFWGKKRHLEVFHEIMMNPLFPGVLSFQVGQVGSGFGFSVAEEKEAQNVMFNYT